MYVDTMKLETLVTTELLMPLQRCFTFRYILSEEKVTPYGYAVDTDNPLPKHVLNIKIRSTIMCVMS